MTSRAAPRKKNVQVVVRVRPLNSVELLEKSRSVVSTNQALKQITLRDKQNSRVFGPFDKVYGEEATQSTLYVDIVAPLIRQVLDGFNCTVFAYGQTGSGKTYTMEGKHDENGAYSWENDPTAGIIPRALHHIFTTLDTERPEDFSIRASYVELYNEQIFDLLSVGTNSLRVYDNKDKGVVISGMEDIPVRTRAEVYSLLSKGAERRKTASTLMNINSSRSHSVFTLTVTTRQTIDNEELLRVGKIHLVDLAGSENIGRSGAIEARAREAALGRVITALTTNAQHIPYRESKLTRILQDSLGGKTITTIIATLSPASSNYEETVSTLEYGQRAKNIKNNPEANQCISRKRVLLAYDEEIARLQRDLLAARSGGGFYVDKENYDALRTEVEDSRARLEELEAELLDKLSELTNVREDLDYMDTQYRIAFENLQRRASRYELRIRENERLRKEMSDLENHYQGAVDALDIFSDVAEKLRAKNRKYLDDNILLFNELKATHDKIDNFRETAEANDHLLGEFSARQISAIAHTRNELNDFQTQTNDFCQQCKSSESEHEKYVLEQQKSMEESLVQMTECFKEAVQVAIQKCASVINRSRQVSVAVTAQKSKLETAMDEKLEGTADFVAKLEKNLTKTQTDLERFAHQEIRRETVTGATPKRRQENILAKESCSPVPTTLELLKRTARPLQRHSVFRVRDSILEEQLPASPATLKGKLPSTLAAIQTDSCDEE